MAKVFEDDDLLDYCRPIIIGDRRVMELGKDIAGINFAITEVDKPSQAEWKGSIPFILMICGLAAFLVGLSSTLDKSRAAQKAQEEQQAEE